ncbi:MAG: helix-turn-helix transcriptional regulator [Rhodocyclaceae bacterium]|jgi:transcriptional regulator with XRE-family HTH domain|nr:helix-turn-helix transcriptional regulator [Rhodocyclaceae bacterium]
MTRQQQLAFPESQEMRLVLGCPFHEYGSTGHQQSSSAIPIVLHENASLYALAVDKSASFGFGARLREARQSAKLSGTELGRGAGEKQGKDASKQSVADWESERHYPKADQLRLICLKLNVSADYLIFGDVKQDAALINAANVVQGLTDDQRRTLLAMMLGPAVSDGHVEKHLPAPPQPLTKKGKV